MRKEIDLKNIVKSWPQLNGVLSVCNSEKDYKRAIGLLDRLIDIIGEDEKHPLSSFLDTLGVIIENYENSKIEEISADPIDALCFLIKEHGLTQADLPELGSQGVVSEILNRRRELNKRQIVALSKRFKVSPMVFFDKDFEERTAA